MNLTPTYDDRRIPKSLTDGYEHHPAADAYMKSLKDIQKSIVTQSLKMKKKDVIAAKLHHRGVKHSAIAEEVGHTPAWVNKVLKSVPCQQLTALLAYYQEALDGPTESARRAGLTRIWHNNEDKQPKVAISAIAELNNMHKAGREAQAGLSLGSITININQETLPKGALDA